MLAALVAIRDARLATLGYPVHLLQAEGPSLDVTPAVPYLVLEVAPGLGLDPQDLPLCGPGGQLQFGLRVKAVGYPADSPVKVLQRARDALTPGRVPSRLAAAGRVIDLVYERLETASVLDRDMRAANFNRHPSWGVDAYTVHAQQA